jgi:hypothetical protein
MNQTALLTQLSFEMIRFDKKVKVYIRICAFLFIFCVAFKLHNSSIGMWNYHMNDGGSEKRGVIVGTPLPIRSDEWLVVTPFILSQKEKGFPTSNEALGYGKTPLAMGLPTTSIVSKMRPALWGYYFLDVERAFAWQWNFKIFPFLIVSFLFLLLFTRNNFAVSLFGSLWLYLSSSLQWWSINTDLFTWALLCLISLLYILYSNKTKVIIINGVLLSLAAYSYAMFLYPPYQIPLAYFSVALLIGFLITRKDLKLLLNKKWIKLAILAGTGIFLASLFYLFFTECKDTIQRMTATVYPGARNEHGGSFAFLDMFKDNFAWFYDMEKFPPIWDNICELSSWLMLSPIASILLIYSWIKTKKIDYLFIPLMAFHIMMYSWILIGYPEFLAKLTLLNNSQAPRSFFVFGFSNVVFTILYLGKFRKTAETTGFRPNMAVVGAVIFVVALILNYSVNKHAERWFSKQQLYNATLLYTALNWLIVYYPERKLFQFGFYIFCLAVISQNIFINPISRGFASIYENKYYQAVKEVNQKDPGQTWMAFGSMVVPDMLKAAGINCLNGVQFAPPLEKLRYLDPTGQKQDVYNRYAHIIAMPFIDGKDSVDFSLNAPDNYNIKMDPSSPRLKQMGVKYIYFTYKPGEFEVTNLVLVKEVLGAYIYKQKDL